MDNIPTKKGKRKIGGSYTQLKQVVWSGYHLLGAIEDGYLARSAPSRRHNEYTRLPRLLNTSKTLYSSRPEIQIARA